MSEKARCTLLLSEAAKAIPEDSLDLQALRAGIATVKVDGVEYMIDCTPLFGSRSTIYWPNPLKYPDRVLVASVRRDQDAKRIRERLATIRAGGG